MRSPSHLVACCLLVLPTTILAQADPQTASLSRTLVKGAEPHHRVQAARVLGDSEDPEALKPLCEGLKDPSGEVRAAAAEALGKLEALKARAPRLYVLFTGVKDTTGTVSPEWVASTEARMRRKLAQMGALLAPEKEAEKAAKGVLATHKLQGYRLLTEIRPGPQGGVKLSVMGLRYPGKQLIGAVEVQASGAEPGELLTALAPQAIEEAASSFGWKK